MKHIFVRTAIVALFATASLAALSAEPKQDPSKSQSPIPTCYQCGHPSGN
jgi:hypothetical protein